MLKDNFSFLNCIWENWAYLGIKNWDNLGVSLKTKTFKRNAKTPGH